MLTLIRLKHSEEIIIARAYLISVQHDAFDESEGECVEDCLDFVETDLPPSKKGATKQNRVKIMLTPHAQQKQKKHAAAHITVTNTEEITLKSLWGTAQQLSKVNNTLMTSQS